MENVKLRLDEWRDAERRRDGLVLGSAEWQDAEEEAQRAATVFHAEVAQASVRYAETELRDRHAWEKELGPRSPGAGDPVADPSLAG